MNKKYINLRMRCYFLRWKFTRVFRYEFDISWRKYFSGKS